MRRLLLARAAVAAAAGGIDQTIILIRHGEKEGDDLSPRGEQRANCLADHFANAGVTALYAYTDKSSRRSTETLTPLSAAIQVLRPRRNLARWSWLCYVLQEDGHQHSDAAKISIPTLLQK